MTLAAIFMKSTLIIIFLLITQTLFANSVDSLQNDKDIALFLIRIDNQFSFKKQRQIQVLPTDTLRQKLSCDGMFEKWKMKNWEKVDLNKDGKTDLLVTLLWYSFEVFIVIDKGDNTFKIIRLSNDGSEDCPLGKSIKLDKKQLLLFYRKENTYNQPIKNIFDFKMSSRIDTLIYKFGGFIELQKSSSHYEISEIQYTTSSGWSGVSPIYKLKFLKTKEWKFEATSENPKKSIAPKDIDIQYLTPILDLIEYMNFKNLYNSYKVAHTDATTMYLKIIFTDGTTKEIEDYGMQGTFGLKRLYELLPKS